MPTCACRRAEAAISATCSNASSRVPTVADHHHNFSGNAGDAAHCRLVRVGHFCGFARIGYTTPAQHTYGQAKSLRGCHLYSVSHARSHGNGCIPAHAAVMVYVPVEMPAVTLELLVYPAGHALSMGGLEGAA